MHKFPSAVLPKSMEDLLAEVRGRPDSTLAMPVRFDHGGAFGGGVHALQVVASWAQEAAGHGTLELPSAFANDGGTQTRFSSTLQGMAALYFSERVMAGQAELNRYQALELVAPRVSAMRSESFANTLRGQGTALCCFTGARSEFLASLYAYPRPGGVRESNDFRVLVQRILSRLGARLLGGITEIQLNYIGRLLCELFKNADEHGSFDVAGVRYAASMRGLVVRLTSVPDQGIFGADSPFQGYIQKLNLLGNSKGDEQRGPLRLIEISVFDTGPGMALRWLGKRGGPRDYSQISREEELGAVQTCFKKHATTKSSQFYGQGLTMALGAMKALNAFMTVRTGRLSLYQDHTRGDTADFQPVDRFAGRNLSVIAGTSYTICFKVK